MSDKECTKCGKTTGCLFTNPMQAGQTGPHVKPSVCRDCLSDIELSDRFYSYYY